MKKYLFLLLAAGSLATSATMTSCGTKKTEQQKRDDLKDSYETLKREIPEADVTFDDGKVKIVLPEAMLFDVNSAVIKDGYKPTLAKIAKVMNRYPKTSVLVTGYTDISGSEELNNELSWKRAESAKEVLINNDVKMKRVYTWGFGAKNPIASNDTELGRKQNRRVEFVILYDYQDTKKK